VLAAGREILLACIEAGGTITGEHGVGLEKQAYMPLIFSEPDLTAMARVRAAVEPDHLFNPNKVLPTGAGCLDAGPPQTRRLSMPTLVPSREHAEALWV